MNPPSPQKLGLETFLESPHEASEPKACLGYEISLGPICAKAANQERSVSYGPVLSLGINKQQKSGDARKGPTRIQLGATDFLETKA